MKITLRNLKKIIKEEAEKVSELKRIRLKVLPDSNFGDDFSASSCPLATQNLKLNTTNRDAAIKAKHIKYGPLNLADEQYWVDLAAHWDTDASVAKQSKCSNCAAFDVSPRMDDCMPGRIQQDGELGYCWMHKFKCHSERTCRTWAAGGPIYENEVSYDWQSKEG